MSKKNFCTLFDSNYLLKGVAMLQSLKKYCPDAHVYVLCMDSKTQEILGRLNLTFVTCVLLADVEDEELLRVKKDRNAAEYCWTLSSCFTWYVLQKNSSIEFITYLDAELEATRVCCCRSKYDRNASRMSAVFMHWVSTNQITYGKLSRQALS